jgi:hypothetical protein
VGVMATSTFRLFVSTVTTSPRGSSESTAGGIGISRRIPPPP